ncbi:hypothetical protein BEI46_16380 [Aliivibrio fischeri]|uniref:restriction endonuclease subunit S n=1 Tax=Aliivibrio fischeri TaxID=668 RepID=UPI00084C5885|nr:restriction endonuclease subunit S [Aliivibrio fischeri]OED53929.1 hypothetical protein BEI46_16380 [Aliivibrio fischeri]
MKKSLLAEKPKLCFDSEITYTQFYIDELSDISTGDRDTKDANSNGSFPFFVRSDSVKTIDTYSKDAEAILTSGDGVGVGKNYHYINGKFDYHQRVYCLDNFSNQVNGKYLYYIFSRDFYKRVIRLSAKNSVDSVRKDMISRMQVRIPDVVEEQQKIADFLTYIDTKINCLTEKHRLLKEYKKGVMQQIFSQKVRFKDEDGKEFPEWKEYALKEILLLQSDSLSMDDEETYELITVKRGFGGVKSRGHFKGKDVLVKNQFTIHENEFVISKRQIVHGACGLVPSELDGAIVSNEYNVFRPVEELLNIDYFNRFTTTPFMRRAFFINSDGVHIEKLLFKTQGWLKTKVHLPCLEEQRKITQFLQAIDVKIEAVVEQIEQTKQFKKGLLQQMFV